jgi:CheY-like chemotaxis protein
VLRDLDQWTRRRLRAIAWRQWKRGRTRFAELRRRGVGRDLAAQTAGSPHGPWRLSNSPALTIALPNAFLRSLGYGVVVAADAAEALKIIAERADIVLLFSDVILGDGPTGTELVGTARRLRPDLRALLTSGYEPTGSDADHSAVPGLELLRKPYRREDLAAAVRRTLDR